MRYVVVSGGGTGIGRAIAERHAAAGDQVILIGRRMRVLEQTVESLSNSIAKAPCAIAIPADLTRVEDVERLKITLDDKKITHIDVLVNNAGGVDFRHAETLSDIADQWMQDYKTNVLTAVLLTSALRSRLTRPGGRIINISSIAAVQGAGDSYAAAKAGILGWTYSLATELGPEGITVNAVVPGFVENTEFFGDRMTPERHQRLVNRTVVGRAGRPSDIAETVFFLASREAEYITGQVLHVNGGAIFGRA
ncbi:SDR family NAD(P)-dependent oxidoreductase [Alicyclobacillus macrosporangiidus]|uniref:SDR family NAD(P)-dependent oxidoreductase n=1 Tax=Alicyclobacillus macrosporangiidus TaxID=392015 RepID=UPI0009DF57EA|nr:SDR family oxidoreductase [Alicyclobacillus macrosporangiidus]